MIGTQWIRDPRIESNAKAHTGSYPTLDTLRGKTLVILNNGWTSMNEIAATLAAELKQRYGIREVVGFSVPIGNPADESVLREAAAIADFAAVGLAN
jgi:hypothetical protein